MNFFVEQMQQKREAAILREQQIVADNAYWAARAAEVKAAEKAQRDRDQRGRQELVSLLLEPGSHAELVMARAKYCTPLSAADRRAPTKFCWMPEGVHEIRAGRADGSAWEGRVVCDERGANAVIASFAALTKAGSRGYVDMAHRNGEAAGWVHGFSWKQGLGIVVAVEWTPAGRAAVEDRLFVSFSPTFYIDHETDRVSGLVPGMAVGGLVNNPAFGTRMPPVLAGSRTLAAQLVRKTMLDSGMPVDTAERIIAAIEAGHSPASVALLAQTLSAQNAVSG